MQLIQKPDRKEFKHSWDVPAPLAKRLAETGIEFNKVEAEYQDALEKFRKEWQSKLDEVNAKRHAICEDISKFHSLPAGMKWSVDLTDVDAAYLVSVEELSRLNMVKLQQLSESDGDAVISQALGVDVNMMRDKAQEQADETPSQEEAAVEPGVKGPANEAPAGEDPKPA